MKFLAAFGFVMALSLPAIAQTSATGSCVAVDRDVFCNVRGPATAGQTIRAFLTSSGPDGFSGGLSRGARVCGRGGTSMAGPGTTAARVTNGLIGTIPASATGTWCVEVVISRCRNGVVSAPCGEGFANAVIRMEAR